MRRNEKDISLDYLLNYCEDSNIPVSNLPTISTRVIISDDDLLDDLHKYDTMLNNQALENFIKGVD